MNYFLSAIQILLFFCIVLPVDAQNQNSATGNPASQDSTAISVPKAVNDSIPQDSLSEDSIQNLPGWQRQAYKNEGRGDIETTIDYDAEDSIRFGVNNKKVFLYGNAKINYGDISLEAAYIEIDWSQNMLKARSGKDSAGNVIGKPVFTDGGDTYNTEEINYNFKTKKAFIKGVVTQQGEGYVTGEKVNKNADNEIFISEGIYTTCECKEDPAFYIRSKKLKLIPGEKVISGPFYMVISDMPTPLGFAFGMFPVPREKNSGIIMPKYGEENRRGFFLRNGGYYFDISDYVDLTLLGEIYSQGSRGFSLSSNYKKRYHYGGRVNFDYNKQSTDDLENPIDVEDFRLSWNHSPESRGNSRFSASVNIATNTYNQNNPTTIERNMNSTLSSSVSYSNSLQGTPFNMNMSLRHSQDVRDKTLDVLLPSLSVNMNRQFPFRPQGGSGDSWYEKISVGYSFDAQNRISNTYSAFSNLPFDVANPSPLEDSVLAVKPENFGLLWKNAQNGGRHQIPISTSFNLFQHFTFSPSISYEELWFPKKLNYTFVDSLNAVEVNEDRGFSRVGSFNGGVGMNTRLYGTFYLNGEKIQAIRHVMTPSISYSINPDFGDPRWGYYTRVQTDTAMRQVDRYGNDPSTRLLSRYQGFAYSPPSPGESQSISFSLNNNLEMKVKNENDTSENTKATEKVKILESLNMGASYNLAADSFNMSNINISARTRIFNNKIDISGGANLDPYAFIKDSTEVLRNGEERVYQRQINEYAWQNGQGLGQITSARLSLSTNLNPQANEEKESEEVSEGQLEYINANPDLYVDFSIPWNLRLSYNLNYRKRGFQDPQVTQSLQMSGDVNLSQKWKVGFRSGYDFERQKLTQTNFDVYRDMDCFEMSFNWTPFGRFQSYSVQINVKSSILRDLKLQRQNSWRDR